MTAVVLKFPTTTLTATEKFVDQLLDALEVSAEMRADCRAEFMRTFRAFERSNLSIPSIPAELASSLPDEHRAQLVVWAQSVIHCYHREICWPAVIVAASAVWRLIDIKSQVRAMGFEIS